MNSTFWSTETPSPGRLSVHRQHPVCTWFCRGKLQPLANPWNSMDQFLLISRSSQWPMQSTCTHRLTRVEYTDLTLSAFMPPQVHRMDAAMEWPWRTRCWRSPGLMRSICANPWYNYKSFSYFGYNLVTTNVTPRDWLPYRLVYRFLDPHALTFPKIPRVHCSCPCK